MTGETKRSGRAVATIVSANYLASARVLCRSLEEHEPSVRRFVLLVERRSAKLLRKDEPFEAVWVEDIGVPDLEDFMSQYTVMEANTAVKPYFLSYLFEEHGIDELVFLDPDVLLLSPLDEVWSALGRGSIVLTPHLREPYRDSELPTELAILRSGTYNLGFIALRRGPSAARLLEWWQEKTEFDCVVDLPGGLFVDQKWMDLSPGYFEGVVVLRDPAYNVAYWNLHERPVTLDQGRYFAADRPIAFFHFSGYDPDRPWVVSKHQNRHDLHTLPVVKRLFDEYAALLRAAGHDVERLRPYGFGSLKNGVPFSPSLRNAARLIRKSGVEHPSADDADAFCRFVMTPNAAVCGAEISPFAHQILSRRPDVAAAYPRAWQDASEPAFLRWLENSCHEEDSEVLYERFGDRVSLQNAFDRIHRLYQGRDDVRAAYPEAFVTQVGFEGFVDWLRRFGVHESDIGPSDVQAFEHAGRTGFESVVEYYLASPELHARFPLALLPCDEDFVRWLVREGTRRASLNPVQIRWFECRRRNLDPSALLLLTALRSEWVRLQFPLGATPFGWSQLVDWARARARSAGHDLSQLRSRPPKQSDPLVPLETLHATGDFSARFPGAMATSSAMRTFADAAVTAFGDALDSGDRAALDRAIAAFGVRRGANLAGYFGYSSGVGSAARSLQRTFGAAGIACHPITLPVCPSCMTDFEPDAARVPARFFERHRVDYEVDVTAANADAMRAARAFLGPGYGRDRRHIGYWVWETDALPGRWADAALGLVEIWTPSEFSARGLRNTLRDGIPVSVLPHAVVAPARSARPLPFALPEGVTLVGSFFDARSVLDRKNPEALLRAFRLAFRSRDKVALVLKLNHSSADPAAVRKLEKLADGLPVIWLRDVHLDPQETSSLLDRLDVYASLHRSEGFGLVLAEAMALEKPVVATGYSANLEFMDESCARLVRCAEITTDRAHGPYPRGTRWAEPDVEHAAYLLRSVAFDGELRRDLGRRARRRIEQTLSPAVVGKTLRRLLGWDGGDPEAPGDAERRQGAGATKAVALHSSPRAPRRSGTAAPGE